MVGLVLFGQYGPVAALGSDFVERYWLSISVLVTLVVGFFSFMLSRHDPNLLRLRGADMLRGLDNGARNIVLVASVIANASIIVAMVGLTGLGVKVSDLIISAAASLSFGYAGLAVFLTLVFAMVVALVLGMGTSTTADYVLCASVVGPALIKLGVFPFAAHMFLFYFATISSLTPPVAAAVMVAAALARTDWWKAGWIACRLAIGGFVAPFMFAYAPELLLLGPNGENFGAAWTDVIWRTVIVSIGVLAFSAAVTNYFLRACKWYETAMLYLAAVSLIFPWYVLDYIGVGLFAAVVMLQKLTFTSSSPTQSLEPSASASG